MKEGLLKPGDVRIFLKSGNEVELVKPMGQRDWRVKRTSGRSKGKEMICNERSLVGSLEDS